MKKVLVITGSPRRGDSYRVTKIIEERLGQLGNVAFTYIFLGKADLKYCTGCLSCMRKGEEACPLKDDALSIRDDLLSADGVIFVSPVYVHTVSALLKNFFDRFSYFLHRPAFFDKSAMVISTTELSGLNETLDYIEFPVRSMGFFLVHKLGIIATAFDEEGPYRAGVLEEIEKASKSFYKAMVTKERPAPELRDIVFFNKLKTKITIHEKRFPYDYEYWVGKGWFSEEYFYSTRINPIKGLIGRLPVKLIKFALRKKLGVEVYNKLVGETPYSMKKGD